MISKAIQNVPSQWLSPALDYADIFFVLGNFVGMGCIQALAGVSCNEYIDVAASDHSYSGDRIVAVSRFFSTDLVIA